MGGGALSVGLLRVPLGPVEKNALAGARTANWDDRILDICERVEDGGMRLLLFFCYAGRD